ncbi:MAG: 6-phosphofructokinase [Clostridia bacterium]|nr:6-phosphofructokinase [Clostridia bacterium]
MEQLIGNAVVGQSGGPTSAINATLSGVIRGVRQSGDVIPTLFGMQNGIEGLLKDNLIDLSPLQNDEEALSLLESTPAAALGSCRYRLPDPGEKPEVFEQLISVFRKHNIRYFFYIGGNDSMDAVAKLSAYVQKADYDIRIMGVPKTIDNDLMGTDHTPGFGSAAKYIATTVKEMIRDCSVYRVKAVTIVEIMGRDAGWLTASAALAGLHGKGPDLIYLPERPFSDDSFLHRTKRLLENQSAVVVAVSEGIRYADGTYVGAGRQSGVKDTFGHCYLSGTGKVLEQLVKEKIGCKVRSVELNLPQRCAAHIASATDIRESVAIGRFAVERAISGVTAHMITLQRLTDEPYRVSLSSSPVAAIANAVKQVPECFINEEGNGVTEEGITYLKPLIIGECPTVFEDGMPKHFYFS